MLNLVKALILDIEDNEEMIPSSDEKHQNLFKLMIYKDLISAL
jgi:hypothetical protein